MPATCVPWKQSPLAVKEQLFPVPGPPPSTPFGQNELVVLEEVEKQASATILPAKKE
jgi:hypothetical protein